MNFKSDKQRQAVMMRLNSSMKDGKGRYQVGNALSSSKSDFKPTKRDEIYTDSDGNKRIKLYNTDIAIINPKEKDITLNSGGYQTSTTKDRINRVIAPTGNVVIQKNGKWFVVNREGESKPFTDGMKIYYGSNHKSVGFRNEPKLMNQVKDKDLSSEYGHLQKISRGSLVESVKRYNDNYFDKSNIKFFGAKATKDNYYDVKNKRYIFGEKLTTHPDGKPRYALGYMNDDQKGKVEHKTYETQYDYQKAKKKLLIDGKLE